MGYSALSRRKAYPNKLDSAYSPVGLWLFDGDLLSTGSETGAGADLTLDRGEIHYAYVLDSAQRSVSVDELDGMETSTTATANLRVSGDVTVQMVYTPIKEERGAGGTALFICGGHDSATANNEQYGFLLADTAGKLEPLFRWEQGASLRVTVTDVLFTMEAGRPHHLVGRRWDTGGSSYTGELWVDGVLIASLAAQTGPDGGTTSPIYTGRNPAGSVGTQIALIHCIKVVNRKLTDAELLDEFTRTGLGV